MSDVVAWGSHPNRHVAAGFRMARLISAFATLCRACPTCRRTRLEQAGTRFGCPRLKGARRCELSQCRTRRGRTSRHLGSPLESSNHTGWRSIDSRYPACRGAPACLEDTNRPSSSVAATVPFRPCRTVSRRCSSLALKTGRWSVCQRRSARSILPPKWLLRDKHIPIRPLSASDTDNRDQPLSRSDS